MLVNLGKDSLIIVMNPIDLNYLAPAALKLVTQVCLQNHGIIWPNNNIFAAKFGIIQQ